MARVYNFSAGPAVLPEEVLREAAAEMLDYQGTGMSVMEMSHRSKAYQNIIDEAEADLRELMNIPANYKVLFLQGGAHQQLCLVFVQRPELLRKLEKHLLQHRGIVLHHRILGEETHLHIGIAGNASAVRLRGTGQNLQKGGLARTVDADDTGLIPFI